MDDSDSDTSMENKEGSEDTFSSTITPAPADECSLPEPSLNQDSTSTTSLSLSSASASPTKSAIAAAAEAARIAMMMAATASSSKTKPKKAGGRGRRGRAKRVHPENSQELLQESAAVPPMSDEIDEENLTHETKQRNKSGSQRKSRELTALGVDPENEKNDENDSGQLRRSGRSKVPRTRMDL